MMLHKIWKKLIGPYRERGTYNNQKESILAFLGYSIGLGNFWRFPYLCYRHGGATFLIPYFVILLMVGIPMYFLEMTLGQYLSWGPIHVFANLSPIFSGMGWAMVVMMTMVTIYYNLIMAWILSYIPPSISMTMPWSNYSPPFNCTDKEESHSYFNSAQNYFNYQILKMPVECEDTKWYEINWELVAWLAFAWFVVAVAISKGMRHTGRILYLTVGVPYALMALLIYISYERLQKEDWDESIEKYFSTVNVTKLQSFNVWNEAGIQVIYSLGVAHGGVTTLASYNTLHQNILRDALLITFLDTATSVLSGFVVLCSMNLITDELPEGKEVSSILVFSVFPALFSKIGSHPLPLTFFCMVFFFGFDSQFIMVESLTTALFDQFHTLRRSYVPVVVATCFLLFLLGSPMCTRGGFKYFQFLEQQVTSIPFIFVGFLEVVVVCYVFGYKRIMKIIKEELKIWIPSPLYYYFLVTWMLVTPLFLLTLLITCFIGRDWEVGGSPTACVLGNLIGFLSLFIVIVAAIRVRVSKGKLSSECWDATEDFCPESIRRGRNTSQYQLHELSRLDL